MKTSWETVQVEQSPMRLYACYPDGPGPFPAMVVIQNKEGVAEFTREMTIRVAEAGYFSVAPDLYHRSPPEIKDDVEAQQARRRDDQVITDVNAAVDFLKGCELADVGKLGIIGFCMGGRVGYLMAAANPVFRAAVDFYGGGIFKAWGGGPSPFARSAEIHCPLQGHFGEDDENPSLADMRKLDAELTRLGKQHEFYSYADAGHAFNRKGWEGYREDADRVSWSRTLDFFAKYLLDATPTRTVAAR